jgi:hypothetical protein
MQRTNSKIFITETHPFKFSSPNSNDLDKKDEEYIHGPKNRRKMDDSIFEKKKPKTKPDLNL